jgi:hypothetical protein
MSIATQYGWQLLNPTAVRLEWDGGESPVRIIGTNELVRDLFGAGTFSWQIPYLFRTPKGWDLHVRGPANSPIDGVAPLEAIVETSWSIAPFAMTWVFTRRGSVEFPAGVPFCQISPIPHDNLREWLPQLRQAPRDILGHARSWFETRRQTISLTSKHKAASQTKHARHQYTRGVSGTGVEAAADEHATRLRVPPFAR